MNKNIAILKFEQANEKNDIIVLFRFIKYARKYKKM